MGRFQPAPRVCRARVLATGLPEEWLPNPENGGTEPGLQAVWSLFTKGGLGADTTKAAALKPRKTACA